MESLPMVGRGRVVLLLVATFLCLGCGSLWASSEGGDKGAHGDKPAKADKSPKGDKPAGDKAALLDRSARTGDPVYLLESLEQRRLDLDKRAKRLDLREADLRRLEEKMAKRIVALEKLRDDLRADLAKESEADDANIAHLAKIFSGMKVKAAASGLKSMDRETAVMVLKVMREKVAAKILSKMDGEEAVKLANELGLSQSEKRRQ